MWPWRRSMCAPGCSSGSRGYTFRAQCSHLPGVFGSDSDAGTAGATDGFCFSAWGGDGGVVAGCGSGAADGFCSSSLVGGVVAGCGSAVCVGRSASRASANRRSASVWSRWSHSALSRFQYSNLPPFTPRSPGRGAAGRVVRYCCRQSTRRPPRRWRSGPPRRCERRGGPPDHLTRGFPGRAASLRHAPGLSR